MYACTYSHTIAYRRKTSFEGPRSRGGAGIVTDVGRVSPWGSENRTGPRQNTISHVSQELNLREPCA